MQKVRVEISDCDDTEDSIYLKLLKGNLIRTDKPELVEKVLRDYPYLKQKTKSSSDPSLVILVISVIFMVLFASLALKACAPVFLIFGLIGLYAKLHVD